MNKEERVKLVFETISKIVGFEIKPNKDFYIWANGEKIKYRIRSDLTLILEASRDYYVRSDYTILAILNGEYQLEEIQEPLLTNAEKEFLRNFKFEELEISTSLYLYGNGMRVNIINLNTINVSFDGLEKDKKYSGKELGL